MTYAALIQPVLWAFAGGAAMIFGLRALLAWRRLGTSSAKRQLRPAIGALLASVLIVPAIGVVPAGQRGVIYRWDGGIDPVPRGEGVTLLVPWLQHLTTTSVRTQKVYSAKVFAQSADLQEITVVASVNYHVEPGMAARLYQRVGPQYASVVIQPALFQRTKAAVGQIKAENFALNRATLADTIQAQLTDQLAGYGIAVEFVNIEDAIFDPAFVEAVKNKIIAEQEAKRQYRLIAAAANVKQQTIIQAQADARSILIRARAQALANRKISASVTAALVRWQYLVKWDGVLPTTLVGDAAAKVALFLNASSRSGSGSGS